MLHSTAQEIQCVETEQNMEIRPQHNKRRHRFLQKYAPPEDKNLLPSRRSKASLLQSKNVAHKSDYHLDLSSEGEDDEVDDSMLRSGHSEIPYIHGPSNQLQTHDITQYRLLPNGDFYCTHCGYAFHNPHKDCHTSRSFSEEFV